EPQDTSRAPESVDGSSKDSSPKDSSPKDAAGSKADSAAISSVAAKEPDTGSTPAASGDQSEGEKLSRKQFGPAKTFTVDVVGKRDWTSSGVIVKRGDRIRITATGSVALDQAGLKTSGPEGLADIADAKKLMPDHATGALIGVIGADNDDFIFIGKSAEF